MPLDLREYIQTTDWTWAEREEKRLAQAGKVTLSEMQNAIYKALLEVPEGKYFDIEKSVKPENREVFIKTTCEFMQYYPDYRFNRLMNRIYHDEQTVMPKKNMTDEERKARQALERERRRNPT